MSIFRSIWFRIKWFRFEIRDRWFLQKNLCVTNVSNTISKFGKRFIYKLCPFLCWRQIPRKPFSRPKNTEGGPNINGSDTFVATYLEVNFYIANTYINDELSVCVLIIKFTSNSPPTVQLSVYMLSNSQHESSLLPAKNSNTYSNCIPRTQNKVW